MRKRIICSTMLAGTALATISLLSGISLMAQANGAGATRPKQAGTKPAAAQDNAWPPRTPDGQPDIQGMWASATHGVYSLNYESLNYLRTLGMPNIPGQITSTPGTPAADASLI